MTIIFSGPYLIIQVLHFGSLQTKILKKLVVQMETSLIRHTWSLLEMIITWGTEGTDFIYFFFNWEQSILLQQGEKRGEITGNKIGLPMEYCGHYGGT